jgi:drug/metabolite transporter (DMT)-like permease
MMWAGNAVVGRLLVGAMPPVAMNAVRWLIVAVLLMPLAWRQLRDLSAIRQRWAYLACIGMLGVGSYNALQYLALHTATPLSATMIGASVPVWMMVVGRVGFGQRIHARQWLGTALSTTGVLLVITQGQWRTLTRLQLVPGDLLMLFASLVWAIYSWMLVRPPKSMLPPERPDWDWAAFLQLQVVFGVLWGGLCSVAEAKWGGAGQPPIWPGEWRTWGALLFIAVGPSIVAYRCWGLGVQAVGPTMAAFFGNLTPIFAALWSAIFLGQRPEWYHPVALVLIMAGIAVSSRTGGGTGRGTLGMVRSGASPARDAT